MSASEFTLVPTTESDRTYIARLNFLTDVFGDEHADIGADFLADYRFYVKQWDPTNGGLIAWSPKMIPAGGAWLVWGNNNDHGYGYVSEDIPEVAIAVEPRYRGKGVGSILLNKSLELARALGTPGLSLSVDDGNPRAKKLYERLGFQHIRHSDAGFSIMCNRF